MKCRRITLIPTLTCECSCYVNKRRIICVTRSPFVLSFMLNRAWNSATYRSVCFFDHQWYVPFHALLMTEGTLTKGE